MLVGTPFELSVPSSRVRDFYSAEWNRPIPLSDKTFYEWQFTQLPDNDGRDNCCIACDGDGNLVGVMGLHERPFHFEGRAVDGAELTTWIVKKDIQNRGVGPQMLQYLQQKYEFLLGLAITPPAVSVYLRHGFRFFNPIPRYMRVLNWKNVEPLAQIDARTKKIDHYWNQTRVRVPYEIHAPDPELVNAISQRFERSMNMFTRSFKYLKWRYTDHPVFNYEFAVIRSSIEGSVGAVVAYRIQDPAPNLRVAHVVDLFGDELDTKAALSYLDDELKARSVDFVDFYSTSGIHQGLLMNDGWYSLGNDNFFNFPHLFNPIEFRSPASTSMVVWSRDRRELIFNNSASYFSKQDSDFDRP